MNLRFQKEIPKINAGRMTEFRNRKKELLSNNEPQVNAGALTVHKSQCGTFQQIVSTTTTV
jgi:hypothetical protein